MKTIALIILFLSSCQTKRLVLSPKDYNLEASHLMAQQNFDQARSVLNNCIKNFPKNRKCHWELGWVYYSKAQWTKTVNHWQRAHTLRPLSKNEYAFLVEAKNMMKIQGKIEDLKFEDLPNINLKSFLNINSVGDVMMGTSYPTQNLPKKNINSLFKNIKSHLSPLAINFLNLEGPLCDEGKSLKCNEKNSKKCYSFRTPTRYIKHLENTFNTASIANNHIMDFGHKCYEKTKEVLSKARIKTSDGFGNYAKINEETIVVSFYTHKLYDYNLLNIQQSYNQIRQLSKKYKIIIVSFHAGAEGHKYINIPFKNEFYKGTKRGNVYKFAKRMIDAGADIILGHGPHIVRSFHLYKEKLIAFSLGNFFTYGRFNLLGNQKHGVILKSYINPSNGNFIKGQLISTIQENGELKLDPHHSGAKLIFALSEIDFKQKTFTFDKNFNFQAAK